MARNANGQPRGVSTQRMTAEQQRVQAWQQQQYMAQMQQPGNGIQMNRMGGGTAASPTYRTPGAYAGRGSGTGRGVNNGRNYEGYGGEF